MHLENFKWKISWNQLEMKPFYFFILLDESNCPLGAISGAYTQPNRWTSNHLKSSKCFNHCIIIFVKNRTFPHIFTQILQWLFIQSKWQFKEFELLSFLARTNHGVINNKSGTFLCFHFFFSLSPWKKKYVCFKIVGLK